MKGFRIDGITKIITQDAEILIWNFYINPQITRFLPLDGTLIFKQIELNTKNSTKQQQTGFA